MGKRQRQRARSGTPTEPIGTAGLDIPTIDYADGDGNVLTLRGALSPSTRRRYAETLGGGLNREDAWQRAAELLFERLAVSWTIAGSTIDRQKELLGRYRMASAAERTFVRESLRAHLAEHFPEMEAP
jgi:hypothetical protein